MKLILENYKNYNKQNLKIEKNILLIKGIYFVIIALISMIFDKNSYGITILYLFPLTLIILALKNLVYAINYKDMIKINWLIINIRGIMYLLFVLYLSLNHFVDIKQVIISSGIILIFNILTDYFIYNNKKLFFINFGILLILSILYIIFSKEIVNNLLFIYFILFIIYGFKDILSSIFIAKKLN